MDAYADHASKLPGEDRLLEHGSSMRRSLVPIVLIACGFVVLPLLHRLFPPELPVPQLIVYNPPRQLADFSFSDGSARSLTLNRFRGHFLLVNIWATWCSLCKDEMASLNHLALLSTGTDLEVIPISDRCLRGLPGALLLRKVRPE